MEIQFNVFWKPFMEAAIAIFEKFHETWMHFMDLANDNPSLDTGYKRLAWVCEQMLEAHDKLEEWKPYLAIITGIAWLALREYLEKKMTPTSDEVKDAFRKLKFDSDRFKIKGL